MLLLTFEPCHDDKPADSLVTLAVTGTHPGTAVTEVDVVEGPDVASQCHRLLQPAEASGRRPTDRPRLSRSLYTSWYGCSNIYFLWISFQICLARKKQSLQQA